MRGTFTGYRPVCVLNGYNAVFDGATLVNGDKCTGQAINEGGRVLFICQSAAGDEYETAEMPCLRLDFTQAEHFILHVRR